MSEIAREIVSQPAGWMEASLRASAVDGTLPPAGARALVLGCGTSFYMAQAYAAARELAGRGETDAIVASERAPARSYDVAVAISRSGTTTEVLRALQAIPSRIRTVSITAVAESPIVEVAAQSVVLEFADERSVGQTRFATSALALLRAHLGHDVGAIARDGGQALSAPLPLDPASFRQFVFLGHGWAAALANEAAPKLREAAGAWTEGYPAMEYRHGPISVAGPETAVWTFGGVAPDLLDDIRETGATLVQGRLDPMAELVLAQRVAVALAEARGLDPDRPRHLARSVVRP